MNDTAGLVSPARVFARATGGSAWLGPRQKSALAHLLGKSSVRILLGPRSSGKTTLLRQFEARAEGVVVLPVSGPQTSASGVLSTLLAGANLCLPSLSEIEQRNLLAVFIEQRSIQRKRIVVCVDKLAKFSTDAWREIERLSHLKQAGRPLIELVIAATEKDGSRAPLNNLLQRSSTCPIEAVHFLGAPDAADLHAYIGWRLARYGMRNMFSLDACEALATLSDGQFNSVNMLCQVLLWDRTPEQRSDIGTEDVHEALARLASLKNGRELSSETQKLERLQPDYVPTEISEAGRLVVATEGQNARQVALGGWIVIGRSKDCDLQLKSRLVSRHHAAVMPAGEKRFFIADLNSRNGVLVNGKFVKRSILNDGDIVDISEFRIRVELNEKTVVNYDDEIFGYVDDGDTDVMPVPDIGPQRVQLVSKK
jgi:hypothetical protein